MKPTNAIKGQIPWNTMGPTCSNLRNMQVLQNIPDKTEWQMNRGKALEQSSFRNGKSNSYIFTNGTGETIFIFKEFYRVLAPSLEEKNNTF